MNIPAENTMTKERVIDKIEHGYHKSSIVFIGGIHGNEAIGIEAIQNVFSTIKKKNIRTYGNIYGLKGNIAAIEQNERFIDIDLNRVWTNDRLATIFNQSLTISEAKEIREIKGFLDHLIENTKAPLTFVDLHTTSSFSPPFAIFSDTLRNRKLIKHLPVTKVLGVLEVLHGTVLGYYGDKGPVTFVFEAGQHVENSSLKRHEAAIWLSLVHAHIINRKEINYTKQKKILQEASKLSLKFVETKLRFKLNDTDTFEMEPGFSNFSKIDKGQKIATYNHKDILAETNDYIFMPLYQKKGEDGFFLVRPISRFWIGLSNILRLIQFEKLLPLLPGVKKYGEQAHTFIINKDVAWFKTEQIFHLLGFRERKLKRNLLYISRRPYDFKGPWDV